MFIPRGPYQIVGLSAPATVKSQIIGNITVPRNITRSYCYRSTIPRTYSIPTQWVHIPDWSLYSEKGNVVSFLVSIARPSDLNGCTQPTGQEYIYATLGKQTVEGGQYFSELNIIDPNPNLIYSFVAGMSSQVYLM